MKGCDLPQGQIAALMFFARIAVREIRFPLSRPML